MNRRIYRSKELVTPKQEKEATSAEIACLFAVQLENALICDAAVLQELQRAGIINEDLAVLIQGFYTDIVAVYTPLKKPRGRLLKSSQTAVHKLAKKSDAFTRAYKKFITQRGYGHKRTDQTLKMLCDDVTHFIHNFELTYSSIPAKRDSQGAILPPSKLALPNRPTDIKQRALFLKEVDAYQKEKGTAKYPRYKKIARAMSAASYKFPERTYGDWKQQHRLKIFDHFIQKR